MRLSGKVALITGGASGIGAATARLFAYEGAEVVVADMLEEQGRRLVETIGFATQYQRLDVVNEESWTSTVEKTVKEYGRLDILVNSAGISGAVKDGHVYDVENWNRIMAVNAKGVFLGTKHVVLAMAAGDGGSIVNLSSVASRVALPGVHMAYSASKSAVQMITKATAVQHAKDGIRANSVHPGFMTPMRTSDLDADTMVRHVQNVPLGRLGDSHEAACAVLFLASDESSYITGSELYVDGGFTAT